MRPTSITNRDHKSIKYRERSQRIGTSRGWFGADLYIMPENFGLACEALAAALERYVRDPGARVESADDAKQSRLERVTESEIRIDSP